MDKKRAKYLIFTFFSLLNDKLVVHHAVEHFFIDIPLQKLTYKKGELFLRPALYLHYYF